MKTNKNDLLDIIDEYDSLICKIGYILTSDRAYTNKLLEEVIEDNSELDLIGGGMEYIHNQLIEELKGISSKLTIIMND